MIFRVDLLPEQAWLLTRIMLFSLLLILSGSSLAQAPLLQPLTPDQGLSQSTVFDLMIDRNGFLWVATAGGLNRFDANKVTRMTTSEHNFDDIAFSRIIEDGQGRIWAAAETIGLYLYDNNSTFDLFMAISADSERERYQFLIDVIDEDPDHLLFILDDEVHRLNKNTGQTTLLLSLKHYNVEDGWFRTLFLHNELLFIGAINGLIQYNLATGKHQYLPYLDEQTASDDQRQVKHLSSAAGRLYIGTVEGLYSLDLAELEAATTGSELANTPLQARLHIADYNIWKMHWLGSDALVATEQGLFNFASDDNTVQLLLRFSDSALGLYNDNILELVADDFGGYWLASRDDGVFYWHPRSLAFEHISRQTTLGKQLSNDKIYQLAADANNNLWIGTSNGLNKVNVATGTTHSYFVSDDTKAVWHPGTVIQVILEPDNPQLLWFVSSTGLNLLDTVSGKLLPLSVAGEEERQLLASSSYYYYAENEQGNSQFYFNRDGKVYRYTPTNGSITELEIFQQLPMHYYGGIVGALPGKPDELLVTTSDQLWIYHSRLNKISKLYESSPYRPVLQRYADQMVLDNYGILWLGINGIGLLGFDSESLELKHHFSTANKLIAEQVYALQKDKAGDIWFSSHNGLSRLQPATLQIEHFSKTDGLKVHEFNGTASTVLADGRIAFGSMRGITLVEPAKLASPEPRPTVNITDISVLAGDFQSRSGMLNNKLFRLTHEDLGIQLQFSAMHFRDNHKMRYRIWLEGRDKLDYPEQQANNVVFPRLRSGNYRFNVVAIAPHTGQESEVSSVTLIIAPAPWRSPWALVLYAIIVSALLYHLHRLRREQQRIINEAHQEVATSEQRLKQALASVDSGAFEWRADKNSLYGSRMQLMLGYGELMNHITLQQHISLIHQEDRANYQQLWQRFLQHPDSSFDITYRLKHKTGHWLWFRDQGRATALDSDEQVLKVTGTYSNITETRANMEKAKLFGEAFQQTRDWVVILDSKQRVIAANQSFSSAFGSVEQYLDNPRTHHLGISLVRRRFYTKLLHELSAGAHWQGEERVITPDGRERPTLINISAIGEQHVAFYVLVFTDITAQKLAEEELRYLANYDVLTGLPNRALLMDRILHAMEQSRRDKTSLALCFIDLDKFKQVNDSLGHDIGDLLLKEVARRLGLSLRERDTVARLGGDEFVVLLEGYRRGENVSMVARKMLSIVSEPMQLGPHTVGVSPSIGIALYPDDALTAQELLKHADVAMYHAKEAGRNNYQFFTQAMNEKAHMQLARETRLRKAHQNNEFFNVYQPIIDSRQLKMVGAEVLMRWQSVDGIVSPVDFIPLAEELRLIVSMTQQLLERALADLSQWRRNGIDVYLSVNLATQHLEQSNLASHTAALLNKYQLPASCLRFEVTESALMNDQQSAIETMLALNALGIQLALDDFGTGYSSLKYLKQLPIDAIKIDRSFVSDIGIDQSDEAIIDAMLSMANSLGMYCIAEGVETTEQLAFFTERKCVLIQGYLFSKPLVAEQIPPFWQQQQAGSKV